MGNKRTHVCVYITQQVVRPSAQSCQLIHQQHRVGVVLDELQLRALGYSFNRVLNLLRVHIISRKPLHKSHQHTQPGAAKAAALAALPTTQCHKLVPINGSLSERQDRLL